MLALVVSVVVAFGSHSSSHAASFPVRGVVVPGKSIAGIQLGMTTAGVQSHWGAHYVKCTYCKDQTWFYEYAHGEPLGAAVRFEKGKVVAVFTLGSPAGWGVKGAMMGDPISNVYSLFGNTADQQCIGYTALVIREGTSTMAFYSASGVVYGYALSVPSLPICE